MNGEKKPIDPIDCTDAAPNLGLSEKEFAQAQAELGDEIVLYCPKIK